MIVQLSTQVGHDGTLPCGCVQDWLVLCAELIVSIQQEHVTWTTPLFLPVEQPYMIRQLKASEKALFV